MSEQIVECRSICPETEVWLLFKPGLASQVWQWYGMVWYGMVNKFAGEAVVSREGGATSIL